MLTNAVQRACIAAGGDPIAIGLMLVKPGTACPAIGGGQAAHLSRSFGIDLILKLHKMLNKDCPARTEDE